MSHTQGHRPGCNSDPCDHHADKEWAKHHQPRFQLHALERCIIVHESDWDRYATNGNDYGWYQFLPATYNDAARMAGVKERTIPWEGTLEEETLAFRALWRVDPEAWETAPDCE